MAIPTDPLFANQWHLRAVNLFTNAPGNPSVWDDYTGAGVNIGIYDGGVQQTHFDLDGNYNADLEYTGPGAVANNVAIAAHGTAVAGVIAAEANGVDTVGVAYDARVTGVTIFQPGNPHFSNEFFTGVMGHMANFDIVNQSWESGAFGWQPVGSWYQIVSDQMAVAAATGRDGLGTIMVSAAGNDRDGQQNGTDSDANVSGAHVGSRHAITVAGAGDDGFVADYSNPGSNILITAPAAGLWNATPAGGGILTTDKTDDATPGFMNGPDGFHAGNSGEMQGTSFAAPIVSGVVALMLEANPELGWRDVKEILASTAVPIGTPPGQLGGATAEHHEWFANGARNWNGGGHFFSEDYGFGGVDARAAVRLAETWTEQNTSANEVSPGTSWGTSSPDIIPDNNASGLTYTFNMSDNVDIETVVVNLNLTHPWAADLWIRLLSPSGTETTLLTRAGLDADVNQIRLTSNAFLGENSGGTWTLNVVDLAASDVGSISGGSFNIFGSQDTIDDTFIYTDAYASLSGMDVWRSFVDGNAGRDLLNASAVSNASTIDLRGTATGAGGNSSIGGAVLRILGGIEDAVSGDGDDLIIGSEDGNWLRGMRGVDQLNGNGGGDSLEGGEGGDRLYAGAGFDTVKGEAGNDVVLGEGDDDVLNGGFANVQDSRGNDGDDIISAGAGNDTIIASLEEDDVSGGDDVDVLSFAWTSQGVMAKMLDGTAEFGAGGSWTNPGGNGGGAWGRWNTTTFSEIENLTGGQGGDTLRGDTGANALLGMDGNDALGGRAGEDRLLGHQGGDLLDGGGSKDTLIGGEGRDKLIGGNGPDRFDFNSIVETGTDPTARDIILDFNHLSDRMDLQTIDAILGGANDAFDFIEAGRFSAAGQVRAVQSGANTLVQLNTEGGLEADAAILLQNVTAATLVDQDFVL